MEIPPKTNKQKHQKIIPPSSWWRKPWVAFYVGKESVSFWKYPSLVSLMEKINSNTLTKTTELIKLMYVYQNDSRANMSWINNIRTFRFLSVLSDGSMNFKTLEQDICT